VCAVRLLKANTPAHTRLSSPRGRVCHLEIDVAVQQYLVIILEHDTAGAENGAIHPPGADAYETLFVGCPEDAVTPVFAQEELGIAHCGKLGVLVSHEVDENIVR